MRCIRLRLMVAIAFLTPAIANAGWFAGPNFGISYIWPEQGKQTTLVGWGGSTGRLGAWQPGLRVGRLLASGRDEIFTDTAFEYLSSASVFVPGSIGSGDTLSPYPPSFFTTPAHSAFQLSVNYQHDFFEPKTPGVFTTVGGGILRLSGSGRSTMVPVFGAGLGYAKSIVQGHGRFRSEARVDYQGESHDPRMFAATLFSLRLGFDLIE